MAVVMGLVVSRVVHGNNMDSISVRGDFKKSHIINNNAMI